MANCSDCGRPVNIHFNEPTAPSIAVFVLRTAYVEDRPGVERMASCEPTTHR
jgi:hypothetical protein